MDTRYDSKSAQDGYLALYISIKWYCEITPETAFDILSGRNKLKKRRKSPLSPQEVHEIIQITNSCWDKLEKRYCIDRHTLVQLICDDRQTSPSFLK